MDFTAPAKVNLYLKILDKREDGYHNIDTIFERISLADIVSVKKRTDSTVIECSDPSIDTDQDSLLGKVVSSFLERYPAKEHFHIQVKKNIPVGAGLGGGSSDAATLLRALNELTGQPLREDELLAVCGGLGADIPFFFKNIRFGHGTGRGDIVKEITTNIEFAHILINPGDNISTKSVYEAYDEHLALTNSSQVDRMFSTFLKEGNKERVLENIHNDLQTIVLREFKFINKAFSILRNAGALGVSLSGSGSTVFGIFDRTNISNAYGSVKKDLIEMDNWKAFLADTY